MEQAAHAGYALKRVNAARKPYSIPHPAEVRLLLSSLRNDRGPASPFEAAGLTAEECAGLDWPRLIQMAAEHGVQPQLYQSLKAAGAIPPAILTAMRAQYYGSSLASLKLARGLAHLASRLKDAGVSAIAFKGPVLALKVRGDLSIRQFNDIDLLVRPQDAGRATEVLIAENYWPRHFNPANAERSIARCYEDEFIRLPDVQMVDLHWDLSPRYFPYGPPADQVWRRAELFTLEGSEVRTMGALDLVLYLAVHGTKHGWANAGAVCDLAAALNADPSLDRLQLLREADEFGCLRMLLLGAALARNLLGAPIPPELADRLDAAPAIDALARGAERRMFKHVGVRTGLYLDWIVPLRLLPDGRSRMHYVLHRGLWPAPEDLEFIDLPPLLYPLYFPLRPVRLLIQHSKRLFANVPPGRKPLTRSASRQ
ncbi:MAG: nucleotidyltransferase family protein [Candidatus Binataceae bacterium]